MRLTAVVSLAAAYLSIIVGANLSVAHFGSVPVAPGLVAPAGVYVAGLAFTWRDFLHRAAGRWALPVVLTTIVSGAALSYLAASSALALGSAAAFGFSELADLAVFQPLHRRHWLLAVVASNTVGLAIDSWLFLSIAFGSLAFLPGQIVGKAWMTAAAAALLWLARRRQVAAA